MSKNVKCLFFKQMEDPWSVCHYSRVELTVLAGGDVTINPLQ